MGTLAVSIHPVELLMETFCILSLTVMFATFVDVLAVGTEPGVPVLLTPANVDVHLLVLSHHE